MMKKLLLLDLAFSAGLGVTQAQHARVRVTEVQQPAIQKNTSIDNLSRKLNAPKTAPHHKVMAGGYGTQIGRSYYDLMTNAASGNHLLRNSDGSLSASWNETCSNSGGSFTNRGAGYNYYNPTTQTWVEGIDGTCPDNYGVASVRLGWPEMLTLANNAEAVIGHTNAGVAITKRATKGTGGLAAWGPTTTLQFSVNVQGNGNNGTWPRAVSNGNNIHMVYCVYGGATGTPVLNGVASPMVYNRSTDGGVTWDKQNVFLPGMDGTNFTDIGGDDYAIAVRGNTVAIVTGSGGQPWTMWKSTDNGNTWTMRNISKVTASDTLTVNTTAGKDTVALVNDAAHSIVIDNNDNVHVWGGTMCSNINVKINGTNVVYAPTGTYYPNVPVRIEADSLRYWSDLFPVGKRPIRVAGVEDIYPLNDPLDWIGEDDNAATPYSAMGAVSMSNAAVHSVTNDIYVVYAAVVEGASNSTTDAGQPFRDLYILKRWANGDWSRPVNIPAVALNAFGDGTNAAQNFEESAYPSVAHEIAADNILHMMWMSDDEPGTTLSADADAEHENLIMYKGIDVSTINFVRITGVKEDAAAFVNNISAFPNPTANKVAVQIDLKKSAKVSVKLANIMGQEVAATVTKNILAGNKDSVVELDLSTLAKGVYTYTVSTNDFTVTKRIVKQ